MIMIKRKEWGNPKKVMNVEKTVNEDFDLFDGDSDVELDEEQLISENTVTKRDGVGILGRRKKIAPEKVVQAKSEECADNENASISTPAIEKNTVGKKTIMIQVMRHSALAEGIYQAVIGDIRDLSVNPIGALVQKEEILVIPFIVTTAEGEVVTVNLKTNKDVNSRGRLLSLVLAIYGDIPEEEFDLRDIENREVEISIVHQQGINGSTWDEIVAVNGYDLAS